MSQISLFPNAYATEPSAMLAISELLDGIRNGKWAEQVEAVRSCEDKDSRDTAKRSVPCVTVSGVFTKRNQSSLVKHSGFICIDIDTECNRTALALDPYTYALFDSVSRQGVAIMVKVKPETNPSTGSNNTTSTPTA